MTAIILKYTQPVLLVFISIFIIFRSCGDDKNTEKNFRRDAALDSKIDSLNSKISGIDDKLLLIDLTIEGTNKQIITNKKNYEKKRKDISVLPADTVYNWTKQRLSERTKR